MPKPLVKRESLKPGENLCDYCTARCCRYYALPIDEPTTWADFDHARWFLLHGKAALFVEDDNWYLMVFAECNHLQPDNRCGIYHDRPLICRSYSTDNCEYEDENCYDKYFETPEQIWEYAEAVLPPKPREKGDRKSTSLPILA